MAMKILSETPVSMAELKGEIDKAKKRDEELNFRAGKTEEYLQQFVESDVKKTKELYEKIEKLNIPRLKDKHIIKIIDVLPKTLEEMKIMFQGYALTINNENMKKIVDTINQALK